ncbi:hypothetical protein [Bacillus sp. FJAT-47783]|nr:hypothetical protein [Bacillus sp. FJAT-47783]
MTEERMMAIKRTKQLMKSRVQRFIFQIIFASLLCSLLYFLSKVS